MDNQTHVPVWAYEAIDIKPPDPTWLQKGQQERDHLHQTLSAFGVKEMEHVGSTSIPHLQAKPIIDLMASVQSFDQIDDIAERLSAQDWHYVPPELDNRIWRRFFVKVKNDKRVAHLHVMLEGEKRWEEQLEFRNRLRENPQLVEEYGRLKRKLAEDFHDDREAYTEAKADFINRVLRHS